MAITVALGAGPQAAITSAAEPTAADQSVAAASAKQSPAPAALLSAEIPDDETEVAVWVMFRGPTVLDLALADGLLADPNDRSTADALAVAGADTQARRSRLDTYAARVAASQRSGLAQAHDLDLAIDSIYDSAMNGALVRGPGRALRELARHPDVETIMPAPELRPALGNAVPLIGADRAAQLGFTGSGVHIAVVDTGVDYTHRTFDGSGDPQDFFLNDPKTVEPGTFPTGKVIGGYDFAGTGYGGGSPPAPDPDPLDEQGHGTHVAGIAAGSGGHPGIHAGVAPDAQIVALKIFGRSGSTNLIGDAIEWAIDANLGRPVPGTAARVDVLNLSLGSDWSEGGVAASGMLRRAVDAGIIVVAAAGNAGNVPFITGSPASAPDALSVASTIAGATRLDKIQTNDGTGPKDVPALEGDTSLTRPIRLVGDVQAPLAWAGLACAPGLPDLSGKIALIERGICTFHTKLNLARAAGAVGAVVFTDERPLTRMGSDSGSVPIPGFMIGRHDGHGLRDALIAGTPVTARLSPAFLGAYVDDQQVDMVSSFSSRGPDRLGAFKPNLSAPGSAITAPRAGGGTGTVTMSGTSMASPMVAGGAAALVDRLRSEGLASQGVLTGGTVDARKAATLIVNASSATAWADRRAGETAAPSRRGVGRLDVAAAAGLQLLVTPTGASGADEPFAVNAEFPVVAEPLEVRRGFRVTNLAPVAQAINLSGGLDAGPTGVTVSVEPESVTLGPGASAEAEVTVALTPALMPAFSAYGGGSAMHASGLDPAEVSAWIAAESATDPSFPPAVLPVFLVPRPASGVTTPATAWVSPAGNGSLPLDNSGPADGMVQPFQVLAEDGPESRVDDRIDVDWVGGRVVTDENGDRIVELLVHTLDPRRAPLESRAMVALDVDLDGGMDHVLFNYDLGLWLGSGTASVAPDGLHASVLADVASERPLSPKFDRSAPKFFADVQPDGNTIILRAEAADLGFAPGEPVSFDLVVSHEAAFSDVAARGSAPRDAVPNDGMVGGGIGTGRLHFDAANPVVSVSPETLTVASGGTQSFTLVADPARLPAALLLSAPFNPPGEDLLIVTVAEGVPSPTATPTATPTASPTPTASATATPTASPTATATVSSTTTAEATVSVTATLTATPAGTTAVPSPTGSVTVTATATSATFTPTLTATATTPPSATPEPTESTPAGTTTPQSGPTGTGTPEPSGDETPSPTPSRASSTPTRIRLTVPARQPAVQLFVPITLVPYARR